MFVWLSWDSWFQRTLSLMQAVMQVDKYHRLSAWLLLHLSKLIYFSEFAFAVATSTYRACIPFTLSNLYVGCSDAWLLVVLCQKKELWMGDMKAQSKTCLWSLYIGTTSLLNILATYLYYHEVQKFWNSFAQTFHVTCHQTNQKIHFCAGCFVIHPQKN